MAFIIFFKRFFVIYKRDLVQINFYIYWYSILWITFVGTIKIQFIYWNQLNHYIIKLFLYHPVKFVYFC